MRPQKQNQTSGPVPDMLMNTWCWMMMEPDNEPCVKQHGHDALVNRFGSEQSLLEWIARSKASPEKYRQRANQMLQKPHQH